jgi:hypothetical protein
MVPGIQHLDLRPTPRQHGGQDRAGDAGAQDDYVGILAHGAPVHRPPIFSQRSRLGHIGRTRVNVLTDRASGDARAGNFNYTATFE